MRLTRIAPLLTAVAAFALVALATSVRSEDAPTGKDLFLKFRCNSCHTVKVASIAKKAPAEGEEAEDTGDTKPPDLSTVGKDHDADFIAKYITKTVKLDGELHKKKFRGTDAELKTLSTWLGSLKTEPKKGK